MGWVFDIASAPRDRAVILETKCGKVTKTYWIEKEGRWAGFAKGEEPIAWQPWPTPSRRRAGLGQHDVNLPIIEDVGGM
ncbi:hypothetical protein AU381_00190 [Sinorhizobium glycinis]|uniref:Uncharacterized protein n=1 Tax=Sinorhizobium glycinis TaxID=1472378 RepID=A0A178XZW4_9HYPH|nr:hypothetical protein [Sinorhizobium glycinis]OAP40382.1 hypothetical protein AU381_00190 [Sinorhizobium glycinis]